MSECIINVEQLSMIDNALKIGIIIIAVLLITIIIAMVGITFEVIKDYKYYKERRKERERTDLRYEENNK